MSRLVDADTIDFRDDNCGCAFDAKVILSKAQTVDALTVRYGQWIFVKESPGNDDYYYCSECGEIALSEYGRYTYVLSDYCPNCGANMKLNRLIKRIDDEITKVANNMYTSKNGSFHRVVECSHT